MTAPSQRSGPTATAETADRENNHDEDKYYEEDSQSRRRGTGYCNHYPRNYEFYKGGGCRVRVKKSPHGKDIVLKNGRNKNLQSWGGMEVTEVFYPGKNSFD